MTTLPLDDTPPCPQCNNLGHCHARHEERFFHAGVRILSKRSFDEFARSAAQGCVFCDAVAQSFALLRGVEPGMRVELLLYPDSPAEVHSLVNRLYGDAVEVYAECGPEKRWADGGRDVARMCCLEDAVAFLQEKYYGCVVEHANCEDETSLLPKRVLDISQSRCRLLEPPDGTQDSYAALSYSWGTEGFAMTTTQNYEELKSGIDRAQLPVVFRDAAALAASLGIRYLWIDTLCIIQDSTIDWEEQAARMGEIFEDATITIAAASSLNPNHTLFSARAPENQEIELFSTKQDVVFKARRRITKGFHVKTGQTLDLDSLDTRAWGFQEKILAPRTLAFTGTELQWKCRTLQTCECHVKTYPSKPLFHISHGTPRKERLWRNARIWSRYIEEYSSRKMTVVTDKLPGLGGLASKFAAKTGYTYIAGLWRETSLYDLVWQQDFAPSQTPAAWLAPSFSWVAACGAVNFFFARHGYPGSRIPHASLVDFCYRTTGRDAYSRAVEGSLTVQSCTVEAVLCMSLEKSSYTLCINGTAYLPCRDQHTVCEFAIDEPEPGHMFERDANAVRQMQYETPLSETAQQRKVPVVLLSLFSVHQPGRYLYQTFLILVKSSQYPGAFERVGVGSGQLYRRSGYEASIPGGTWHVRPWEWLAVNLGERAEGLGGTVEQVVCIR
ncbi:hypothetical protein OPT61_g4808 [Boeremia exigua]|uniref:Uncharacterized protein n=1 Tax=Boeremia exigua TaxID=749465 RepID=A0ACC2ICR9_9PLEO|nr:hypothetical protein OPT61_g4808 [Boeremia exigua]